MIATLEALVVLITLAIGVLVYRYLIRSQWFTRLIGGVVEVPPTTDDEVVHRMTTAESVARQRAVDLEVEVAAKKRTAQRMRRKVGPLD